MANKTNIQSKRIVIFASGTGTNAENIIRYFREKPGIEVSAVLSNRKSAEVLKRAHNLNVKALYFDREALYQSNEILHVLQDIDPDLIVLAGFLWVFPKRILQEYHNKVINLHPALLPKYGGKGMYGINVHAAVLANEDLESGISIHYVDDNYDEGEIIFQKSLKIDPDDTPETLAKKIHFLEYEHFPRVIEKLLQKED